MEQMKLIDAGVFILKKKYWVMATALIVALLMVVFCCIIKPAKEETITLKLTNDAALDTFITQPNENSTLIMSAEGDYPFDDKVTTYIEDIKPSKVQGGRVNPYLTHNRLDVENMQIHLAEDRFFDYLYSNGINGFVDVSVTDDNVKITVGYDPVKDDDVYLDLVVERTLDYLTLVTEEYIGDTLETHKKLLEEDQKVINQIIADYGEASKAAPNDPLSLEKCRSLLSTYAQAAYNSDVSNTVVMASNQLLAVDIRYNAEILDYSLRNNNGIAIISVFGLFGLVVGAILGSFGVYIFSLMGAVLKTSKGKISDEATPSQEDSGDSQ